MQTNCLSMPTRSFLKKHVTESLNRYWPENAKCIASLPIQENQNPEIHIPLVLVDILLPEWAEDCGIDGVLPVPAEACISDKKNWQDIDWLLSAFLLLESWHERLWEEKYGPIHSYSTKLKNWDTRIWDRAWVNRIALFLRRWSAKEHRMSEEALFGPMPKTEFLVTHDVDAVRKTGSIRLKQSIFLSYNSFRFFLNGDISQALLHLKKGFSFLFGRKSWWTFEDLIKLESGANVQSCFNFYADNRP